MKAWQRALPTRPSPSPTPSQLQPRLSPAQTLAFNGPWAHLSKPVPEGCSNNNNGLTVNGVAVVVVVVVAV